MKFLVIAAVILALAYLYKKSGYRVRLIRDGGNFREWMNRRHEIASGRRCNICKERYVGLAQDCRCTNYGRV